MNMNEQDQTPRDKQLLSNFRSNDVRYRFSCTLCIILKSNFHTGKLGLSFKRDGNML